MSWGTPVWLWALLGLPVLAAILVWGTWSWWQRLHKLAAPETAARILTVSAGTTRTVRAVLIVVAVAFMILALARPRWGTSLEPIETRGVDVLIAVDVSRSMLAEDVRPNRLALARAAAGELADRLGGDRVGLIAFAGTAQTICPLTLDRGALHLYLSLLSTDLISRQGTILTDAMTTAMDLFRQRERSRQILVLITDGEGHEGEPVQVAREAAREGIIIYTVGVGTPAGQPIPMPGGSYKTDAQGNIVTSRLDVETLRQVAETTGGIYVPAAAAGDAIEEVASRIAGQERGELTEQIRRRQRERYAWPLSISVIALLLGAALVDRRRRFEMEVVS
jgi:Ca-activated chloride channel family protein